MRNYRYAGAGSRHMDKIMIDFLRENSAVIVRRNLGRNFIAHLASFSSVGAVKFTTIYDCMLRLQQCMKFKDKLALTEYNLPWRESYMDTEADQLLASSPSSLGSTSSPLADARSLYNFFMISLLVFLFSILPLTPRNTR